MRSLTVFSPVLIRWVACLTRCSAAPSRPLSGRFYSSTSSAAAQWTCSPISECQIQRKLLSKEQFTHYYSNWTLLNTNSVVNKCQSLDPPGSPVCFSPTVSSSQQCWTCWVCWLTALWLPTCPVSLRAAWRRIRGPTWIWSRSSG